MVLWSKNPTEANMAHMVLWSKTPTEANMALWFYGRKPNKSKYGSYSSMVEKPQKQIWPYGSMVKKTMEPDAV